MKEIWKDIPGYELHYEVSNTGKVRNKRSGKILKPFTNSNNHFMVGLSINGNTKRFLVHRLIALVFLQNPKNLPIINHKDGNPSNNNVENLEWCTQKHNIHHSFKTGLYPIKKVICVETNEVFRRAIDAARKFNIHSGPMSRVLNGYLESYRGLHFKYID